MELLPRHRHGQGEEGGQKPASLPVKMPPMIKITTKPYVFSVFISVFAYATVYEYSRLILILTTRWPCNGTTNSSRLQLQ